jgi:hypothetical protein
MSAANGDGQQSLLGSLWSLGGSMYQYAAEQMNKYVAASWHAGFTGLHKFTLG